MTSKIFHIDPARYNLIRDAMSDVKGEELFRGNSPEVEFYFISTYRTAFVYYGKKIVKISGTTEVPIRRTVSKLAHLSGVKFTEIKNDR